METVLSRLEQGSPKPLEGKPLFSKRGLSELEIGPAT